MARVTCVSGDRRSKRFKRPLRRFNRGRYPKRIQRLRIVREISEDGLFDAAAGVAFWLLLSIPAAVLVGLSSVSLLSKDLTDDLQSAMIEFIERVFTSEAA